MNITAFLGSVSPSGGGMTEPEDGLGAPNTPAQSRVQRREEGVFSFSFSSTTSKSL